MEDTKTGAVVCKKSDPENEMAYEALLFITGIPHDLTDEKLKERINLKSFNINISSCFDILFRADIHATSNEVQEQFEHLDTLEKPVPRINFEQLNQPE